MNTDYKNEFGHSLIATIVSGIAFITPCKYLSVFSYPIPLINTEYNLTI